MSSTQNKTHTHTQSRRYECMLIHRRSLTHTQMTWNMWLSRTRRDAKQWRWMVSLTNLTHCKKCPSWMVQCKKKVYYFLKGEVLIVSSLFECNTRMLEKGFGHSKYSSCVILAMKKSTTSLHCKKLGSKSTVLILCVKQKSEVQLNLSSFSQIRFSKVTLMFSKFNVNHVHHIWVQCVNMITVVNKHQAQRAAEDDGNV